MDKLHALFLPTLIAAFLAIMPAARAQTEPGPQTLRQYPGFIELTTVMKDGSVSVLRCGYAVEDGKIAADTGFRELSVLNRQRKSYSRIQRIDNQLIATATNPHGDGLLLELVEVNGTVVAKACAGDPANDTLGACRTVRPFTFIDQIKAGDAKIGKQCALLLQQGGAKFDPSVADPEKAQAFKDALRQKAEMLAAP